MTAKSKRACMIRKAMTMREMDKGVMNGLVAREYALWVYDSLTALRLTNPDKKADADYLKAAHLAFEKLAKSLGYRVERITEDA